MQQRFLNLHNILRGLAVYAMMVFAFASTASALAASTQNDAEPSNGIWVKLCATGGLTFISFDDGNEDDNPSPTSHAQACHVADRRAIGHDDDTRTE